VLCNIPGTKQVTAQGAGHKIVVKPPQKIQPDNSPQIQENVLTPKQQPPAKTHYYLADDENTENTGKNTDIHLMENLQQPIPSLLSRDPKNPGNNAACYHGNTEEKEYTSGFLWFPVVRQTLIPNKKLVFAYNNL
jgi:hypothetical protein